MPGLAVHDDDDDDYGPDIILQVTVASGENVADGRAWTRKTARRLPVGHRDQPDRRGVHVAGDDSPVIVAGDSEDVDDYDPGIVPLLLVGLPMVLLVSRRDLGQ